MENYENEELFQEEIEQEEIELETASGQTEQPEYHEPDPQPYHGTGTGRKESPFANSPYVTNYPKQESRSYEEPYIPPVPPREMPRKVKKARSGKGWKIALCAVLALVVVAGSCTLTATLINNSWEAKTDIMAHSFQQRMDELQKQIDAANSRQDEIVGYQSLDGELTPGAVYQKNVQSVVLIKAQVVRSSSMFGQTATGTSSGSGFVLTEDGHVVTNHHVVENATKVTVIMHDGTEYTATLVGSDETNDVAVLKINEDVSLKAVEIGSSDALRVGDQVVAIGNPLGELTSTLTVGYVSAKERNVPTDGSTVINMIQTDAAINSGNSGGPLFNAMGQVVGITTAKYSGSSSSGASIEGIGFAIPINDAMPLVDDLINYGYINSAYLGVIASDMDPSAAAYYGMPVGAYVQEVAAGYCAEKAGIRVKDIIVAVGNYKVESVSELIKVLRKFRAGDTTIVTVYRGGQELKLSVTLDDRLPQEIPASDAIQGNGEMPQEGNFDDWFKYFEPFFEGNG